MGRPKISLIGAIVGAGIIFACGGSKNDDLFSASGSTSSSSGDNTSSSGSSSGTTSSSGSTTSSSGSTTSSSGSTTSSGGSSGTSSSGGVDAGKTCRPSVPADCASNEYCKVTTCGQTSGGTCTTKATTTTTDYTPVCGCDNITYWNASVASMFGQSIKSTSTCASGVACTDATPCANGRFCNYQLTNSTFCGAVAEPGECWGLPTTCPVLPTGSARACGSSTCTTYCEAVRAEHPFYYKNPCN